MTKNLKKIGLIIAFIFMMLLFNNMKVSALIQDDANLFTAEEETKLEKIIEETEKKIKSNIMIYTYSDYKNIDNEGERWFLQNVPDKYDGSFIFVINLKSRTTLIKAYDKMKWVSFSDDSGIVADTASYLSSGNTNAKAIEVFCEKIPGVINSQRTFRFLIFELIVILIASAIMFVTVKNAGGKVTVSQKDYVQTNKSRIFNNRDIYIRTETTRTKKSSSSGGGGSSRGGHGGHGHF